MIGADLDYVKSGFSYYTAESHICHFGEAKLGDQLTGTLQILAIDEKRAHIFITILRGTESVATIEQMLLHVDMAAGKACAAPANILTRLTNLAQTHASLPHPERAGRMIGQRKT